MTCNVRIALSREEKSLESVDKTARETRGVDPRAHMEATNLQTEINARITELLKECEKCKCKYPVRG